MRSDVSRTIIRGALFGPSSLFELRRNSLRYKRARRAVAGSASEGWWSQTGSNRRPHACKARALPAELWPRNQKTNAFTSVVELHLVETHSIKVVGLGRLELPTSRLSSARSNQLSYKPLTRGAHARAGMAPMHRTSASPWRVFVREERET